MHSKSSIPRSELVFGIQPVLEALKAEKEIDKLLIKQQTQSDLLTEVIHLARERKVNIQYVPLQKLNRITTKNHQGVIAFVSPIFFSKLDPVVQTTYEKGETPLVVLLDRITDVRNFGAIARTAECAGVHALVVPQKGGALINSEALKTSSGALNLIPVCKEENLKNTITYLQESGLQLVACTEMAEKDMYDLDFTIPTAIVMGSEGEGISNDILRKVDHCVRIPMMGKVGSLNVSVATAVILYEIVRQRMKK